jgi:hypothetical protein
VEDEAPMQMFNLGVVRTTTKVVRRMVHRGWWLCKLDLMCSSRGRTKNPISCKQVFWISISSFYGTNIIRKGIQKGRRQVDWNQGND